MLIIFVVSLSVAKIRRRGPSFSLLSERLLDGIDSVNIKTDAIECIMKVVDYFFLPDQIIGI